MPVGAEVVGGKLVDDSAVQVTSLSEKAGRPGARGELSARLAALDVQCSVSQADIYFWPP